ncbi:hypothetical protein [Streptomyces sp. NPDC050145]|uniref:hypothetical protein n=1 Tax=Streptomyces sp. NPDC050145 TaxID=3365602 RepID=UPI0037A07919
MGVLDSDRRRLARGLALAVAGALLGAGGVAWGTGTLPLFGAKPCWDAVADRDVEVLVGDHDVEHSEIRPAWVGGGELQGSCRLLVADGQSRPRPTQIRVHDLKGLTRDNLPWADEFLSTRMTPLGGDLLGMASDTRAWVALPDACHEPGRHSGPAVVDAAVGDEEIGHATDAKDSARNRQALARIVVDVANRTMETLDCQSADRLSAPREPAPEPAQFEPIGHSRKMCGLKNVTLPEPYRDFRPMARVTPGGADVAPAWGCDVRLSTAGDPEFRLRTVQEPALTGAFSTTVRGQGLGITNEEGRDMDGSSSPTVAALRANCSDGPAVFIAEDHYRTDRRIFVRQVFLDYVAAEAARLDCEPLHIRLPA